jgi:hypothetical protein
MRQPIRDQFGTIVDYEPLPPSYLVGVDLAQASDYTAVSFIEQKVLITGSTYDLRHLERFQNRPYTDVGRHIRNLVAALRGHRPRPDVTVVVDGTGVGRAALDIMNESDIDAQLISIVIHGGDSVSGSDHDGWRVPKRDLVSAVAVVMQANRLHIRPTMSLAPVLSAELQNFKLKFTKSGHDQYQSWREEEHDDCVLSAALAIWYAERPKAPGWEDMDPGGLYEFFRSAGVG